MLVVDSVTLALGGTDILSGCYLKGSKGEVVGLLGRNGSGKSSFFKVVFGSLKANYKHLRIGGRHVEKGYLSREVAYLPQESFLPPFLRVDVLLQEMSDVIKVADCWKDLVAKVGGLYVRNLSGGAQRMLECLWILNQPAGYVLLDEPFSGIAPVQVESLSLLIRRMAAEKCIIVSDHLYESLLAVSDRLYLFHNKALYPVRQEEELKFYGYLPQDR